MQPRLSAKAEREMEDSFRNNEEAHTLLDLIDSEFRSDPMSTQCFDSRIVERVRYCVVSHKAFIAKRGF
jgi:hypothetical protein